MEIRYLEQADEDLAYWIKTGNKAIIKKIAQLTRAILEDAYQGIGKPEALKHELSGKWFRRITQEHRYVYEIFDDTLFVISLKGHY